MEVEPKDPDSGEWRTVRALLDSGSQGDCINRELSENYLTTRCLKSKPTTMIMADGNCSPAGPITHYSPINLRIAGHEECISMDIACLSHKIILGMLWHKKHSPKIDYQKNILQFTSKFCRRHCGHYGRSVPLHPERTTPEPVGQKPQEPERLIANPSLLGC